MSGSASAGRSTPPPARAPPREGSSERVGGGAWPLSTHASSRSMKRSIAFETSMFCSSPRCMVSGSDSPPEWLVPRTSYNL